MEDASNQQTTTAPPEVEVKPAAEPAAAERPPGFFRRFWNGTKHKADITWRFTKELFNDHTFWVKALAVKGGASAVVVTGLVATTAIVNMPIFLAIGVGTLGVGLIVGGVYGMAAGGIKAWEGIQDVYARTMGRAPKEHVYKERKDIIQRIEETAFAKRIAQTKWAQKIVNSHAWKTTMKFTRRSEDSMLGGIAVGGALISLAIGAVALPFVAAGTISTLLTIGMITRLGSFVSGLTGLYFSYTGIKEENRMKREHKAREKAENAQKHKLGNLFGWAKQGQDMPQIGDDAPFAPIGHPYIPADIQQKIEQKLDAAPKAGPAFEAVSAPGTTTAANQNAPVVPVPKIPVPPSASAAN